MQTDLFTQQFDRPINNDFRIDNQREADDSIDKSNMHKLILKAMQELKVRVTFFEIAKHLKLKDSQIWKRLKEMEEKNLIVPNGTKVNPESGRKCSTWMIKN